MRLSWRSIRAISKWPPEAAASAGSQALLRFGFKGLGFKGLGFKGLGRFFLAGPFPTAG